MPVTITSPTATDAGKNHERNIHQVNPDIKIHTVVSEALDHDHKKGMLIPLGECSDEQLLAEVSVEFCH